MSKVKHFLKQEINKYSQLLQELESQDSTLE